MATLRNLLAVVMVWFMFSGAVVSFIQPAGAPPATPTYQDFTTWSEDDDTNNKLSQTSTRSTWANLTYDEGAGDTYLEGSGFSYAGDLSIAFDFLISSSSSRVHSNFGALFQMFNFISTASSGEYGIMIGRYSGNTLLGTIYCVDYINEDIDVEDGFYGELSLDTTYYALFSRDADAGANGTIYFKIYGSSANRDSDTSALISLSLPITALPVVTIDVIHCPYIFDCDNSDDEDGYVENLALNYPN